MTQTAPVAPAARISLVRRVGGYILMGGLSTLAGYLITVALRPLAGINVAATVAWVVSVLVAFVVNRRVTFGLAGPHRRWRELVVFSLGAVMQLLLSLGGYWVTLGRLRLDFNLAFAINIAVTTVFGFAYVNLIAYRGVR